MTAQAVAAPIRGMPKPATTWGRIYGLGSVYAKTLHDSRLAVIIFAGILGAIVLAGGASYGKGYSTPQSRAELVNLFRHLPPALAGIYGNPFPAHLERIGGLVSIKNAGSMALAAALWSVFALSGTLASEARRGSLDMVATTRLGRRRIALEKLAAHLTGMGIVVVVVAICSWLVGKSFATMPGDAISVESAVGFASWVGLLALVAGSLAFALAPVIGRASAGGVAGMLLVGGYLLNGYRASAPALSGWSNISPFKWTADHQALAGQYDWPSLVLVAGVAVVLFAVGVEAFARRDLGSTSAIPWPGMPAATLGLSGPATRSLGERLPMALAWGAGIGLFGLVLGASAGSFNTALAKSAPDTLKIFHTLFPKIDLSSAGGFLELAFVSFGFILIGFAASTLVGGWASDESSGRLEMLLAAPVQRARWAISSGLGVLAAVAVMTALVALGVGIGAATVGGDFTTPILGSVVLGLYAAGLAGIGLAVGGLVRPSLAGEAVAAVVTITFLLDLLAPGLKLPDWVHQLALTSHMGQPMTGYWDWGGILACVGLAVGGLALSAWGMSRRDIGK